MPRAVNTFILQMNACVRGMMCDGLSKGMIITSTTSILYGEIFKECCFLRLSDACV